MPHNPTPHDDLGAYTWRATVEYIVTLIESEAIAVRMPDGSVWHDVRPLISRDENCAEVVDMNRELIDLGLEMRVLARSPAPDLRHLVHINAAA